MCAGGIDIDELHLLVEAEDVQRGGGLSLAEAALRAGDEGLLREVRETLDAAVGAHQPMHGERRDREEGADLAVARVMPERLVAAFGLGDDVGRRGEDVVGPAPRRVHDVLHRPLALLDHQGERAVAAAGDRLGKLHRKGVVEAVGLAGAHRDRRHAFRRRRGRDRRGRDKDGQTPGRRNASPHALASPTALRRSAAAAPILTPGPQPGKPDNPHKSARRGVAAAHGDVSHCAAQGSARGCDDHASLYP